MKIQHTFHVRRYWLRTDTPQEVLNTLNYSWGQPAGGFGRPYVDIEHMGSGNSYCTLMELRYSDYIHMTQDLTTQVVGDDGL